MLQNPTFDQNKDTVKLTSQEQNHCPETTKSEQNKVGHGEEGTELSTH